MAVGKRVRTRISKQKKPVNLNIRSEDEAFSFLQRALENEFEGENVKLEFKNWPLLSIKYEGKGYDSTVTPKIAETLVNLQHTLNRTYARSVRGNSNANILTHGERRSIELKAKVKKGSSLVEVNLGDFASKLASQLVGRMNGTELAVTVLGLALVGGGTLALKWYLNNRAEKAKLESASKEKIALSEQETRRLELITQALGKNSSIRDTRDDFDDIRHDIIKSVGDADRLKVQGVLLLNAEARELSSSPRSRSEECQLNGHYKIVRITWAENDMAKIVLSSIDGIEPEFTADLNVGNFSREQRDILKACEWDKKKVYFSVNAMKLRGEVTKATIVGVEWPKDSPA